MKIITKLSLLVLGITTLVAPVWGNDLGIDFHNFNPTPNQLDFFTVHSSRVQSAGGWNFAAFMDDSQNNLLIYKTPIITQDRLKSKDNLLGMDLLFAYGISDRIEYGLALPMVLSQSVDNQQLTQIHLQKGLTSIRNQIKFRLGDQTEKESYALVFSIDLPNVRQDPYTGNAPSPIMTGEFVSDWRRGKNVFALNGGYRLRHPGDAVDTPTMYALEDQVLFSGAWNHQLSEKANTWNLITEFYGHIPSQSGIYKNPGDVSSLEILAGLKTHIATGSYLQFGAGTNLWPNSMAPDYRLFVGFNMHWMNEYKNNDEGILYEHLDKDSNDVNSAKSNRPLFPTYREDSDNDGVDDEHDACPNTHPGTRVGPNGCPMDSDQDGIPDSIDQCPNTPPNSVVDKKGCPVNL